MSVGKLSERNAYFRLTFVFLALDFTFSNLGCLILLGRSKLVSYIKIFRDFVCVVLVTTHHILLVLV